MPAEPAEYWRETDELRHASDEPMADNNTPRALTGILVAVPDAQNDQLPCMNGPVYVFPSRSKADRFIDEMPGNDLAKWDVLISIQFKIGR